MLLTTSLVLSASLLIAPAPMAPVSIAPPPMALAPIAPAPMALAPMALASLAPAPTAWVQGDPPLPPQHTGLLYVSGFVSNNVVELAPDGTFLREFGTADTVRPRGVAVDDVGNIIVVCQASNRIQIFDLAGGLLDEVVHPDLSNGTGISRAGNGNWLVGNFFPGAILEFDRSWQHVRTITNAAMSGVNCVSVEPGGGLSVTDAVHASVHRFDAARHYLGEINHPTLASPMSIARDSTGNHYVSNGLGLVSKFDAAWNFQLSMGQGLVSQPQGIVIDEDDVLTITNYSSSAVLRFDTQGTLLDSFTLNGAATGRNASWQTSRLALAMGGSAEDASGVAQPVLRVNGAAEPTGRMSLGPLDPIRVELTLPPGVSNAARAVVYAWTGEATPSTVVELPGQLGLFARSAPFTGGTPSVLSNSFGRVSILGQGPPVAAPGTVLDLPAGAGRPITITVQGLIEGPSGTPVTTNAVIIDVR